MLKEQLIQEGRVDKPVTASICMEKHTTRHYVEIQAVISRHVINRPRPQLRSPALDGRCVISKYRTQQSLDTHIQLGNLELQHKVMRHTSEQGNEHHDAHMTPAFSVLVSACLTYFIQQDIVRGVVM